MNPRYVETFSRHRKLFLLPVVLAVFFAVWYIVGAPKAYLSTTSLWFDNAPSSPSSVGNTNAAILPPSSQEQQVLTELLSTRSFRLTVAKRGPLARYLAHHSANGWGPTAVLKGLGGASLDDKIMAALGPKQVVTTIAGPQVLGIGLRGPTPAVASGTLRALVDEFEHETNATFASRGQASVTYFEDQVASASTALQGARQAVATYLTDHPAATVRSDLTLRSLTQAEKAAAQQLVTATNTLNQAKLNAAAPAFGKGSFRVLDEARLVGAVSSHKKELAALIGGLFVGGLLSLLGIVVFTKLEEAGADKELATAPAATAAGPVPVVATGTSPRSARAGRVGSGMRRAGAGFGRQATAASAALAARATRVRGLRGTRDAEPEATLPALTVDTVSAAASVKEAAPAWAPVETVVTEANVNDLEPETEVESEELIAPEETVAASFVEVEPEPVAEADESAPWEATADSDWAGEPTAAAAAAFTWSPTEPAIESDLVDAEPEFVAAAEETVAGDADAEVVDSDQAGPDVPEPEPEVEESVAMEDAGAEVLDADQGDSDVVDSEPEQPEPVAEPEQAAAPADDVAEITEAEPAREAEAVEAVETFAQDETASADEVTEAPEPDDDEAVQTVDQNETASADEPVEEPASEPEPPAEATVGAWEGSRAQHLLPLRAVEMSDVVRVSVPEDDGTPEQERDESDEGILRGTIIRVRDDGKGRSPRPVWTILQPANGEVSPVEGSRLKAQAFPRREGVIRERRDLGAAGHEFEVEITAQRIGVRGAKGQLAIRPVDGRWVGREVAFVEVAAPGGPDDDPDSTRVEE